MGWYKILLKPAIDYVIAVVVLLIGWPFLLIVYLINKLVFTTGFFIQERIGRNEMHFNCLKFRSMKTDGDENSIPLWGKFLRYSSIDELPQVINILRGEMSLVGPRPLLPEYVPHYSEEQRKRHLVKPGITGLAQVSGRNKLAWQESLALDAQYAQSVSFLVDMKILLRTITQVFKFGQVQESPAATRGAFTKESK